MRRLAVALAVVCVFQTDEWGDRSADCIDVLPPPVTIVSAPVGVVDEAVKED